MNRRLFIVDFIISSLNHQSYEMSVYFVIK